VSDGGDSGVSSRMFGQLLTWLSDHTADIFTLCTCNNISKLPPEFSRAERFDGIFFFDMLTAEERVAVWEIYLKMFTHAGYNLDALIAASDGWTGAEIRACCRLAALLGRPVAAQMGGIVPVAVLADNTLSELRIWASGRCLSTRKPGLYYWDDSQTPRAPVVSSTKKRRRTVSGE